MIKFVVVLCTLLAPTACRAQLSDSSEDESDDSLSDISFYEKDFVAQEGEGRVTCVMNEDSTYVLCKRSLTDNSKIAHPIRAYAVYDLQTQKKTYAGRIDGNVQWYDQHTIHIERLQRVGGGAAQQKDYHTYVDVRFGKPTTPTR